MEPRFPLALTKLPQLRVDRTTIAKWKHAAREEVAAVLRDRESWYYRGQEPKYAYKLIYNKRGLEGYICTAEAAARKEFYAHGVLKMYLEDVSYGLYADCTLDQRSVSAAHADLVYFECSFATRDAEGRAVLVQHLASPNLSPEHVQESHDTERLARGRNYQITTFRSGAEGTHCQSSGTLVANEMIPSWVGMKSVLQVFSSLSNVVALADARAVARLGVAKALSAAKACNLCKKKFSLMRPRQNCRACGHSICKSCTIKLKFCNAEGFNSRVPVLAEDKFCLPCVRHAREKRPESDDPIAKFVDSVVSEDSNCDVALGIPVSDDDSGDELVSSSSRSQPRLRPRSSRGATPPVYTSHFQNDTLLFEPAAGQMRSYSSYNPAHNFAAQMAAPPPNGLPPPPSFSQYHVHAGPLSASVLSLDTSAPPQRGLHPSFDDVDFPASDRHFRHATAESGSEAISKLTQSIAAQEALLQNIEFERQKLQSQLYPRTAPHVPQYIEEHAGVVALPRRHSCSGDRFEVLPDSY
ncbi:hypothetical protein PybrP1_003862 [[Pythium] brassicae (nom. inval.)]|nr:hypothetical protein PybrP1_003862 [[Pythium] brassicae (nom. inval.)]